MKNSGTHNRIPDADVFENVRYTGPHTMRVGLTSIGRMRRQLRPDLWPKHFSSITHQTMNKIVLLESSQTNFTKEGFREGKFGSMRNSITLSTITTAKYKPSCYFNIPHMSSSHSTSYTNPLHKNDHFIYRFNSHSLHAANRYVCEGKMWIH